MKLVVMKLRGVPRARKLRAACELGAACESGMCRAHLACAVRIWRVPCESGMCRANLACAARIKVVHKAYKIG